MSSISDLYKVKGNITVVKSHGHCVLCDKPKPARLVAGRWVAPPPCHDALFSVRLDNHANAWGNVCLEHWLLSIDPMREGPFLGTGVGQFLMHDMFLPAYPFHGHTPKAQQTMFGDDSRYTMLIRGNTVAYTQDRRYNLGAEPPKGNVSCIFDIQTRLIPHESDVQDGGIKIWLQKARGGEW